MSGHAYLGIARSFRREKNTAKASEYYKKFLAAFTLADQGLPQLGEARNFIADHAEAKPSL